MSDGPTDQTDIEREIEAILSYGCHKADDVRIVDGAIHLEWSGRWLPSHVNEDYGCVTPIFTELATATSDPGGGFMADPAYYCLGQVDETTLVDITAIDGVDKDVIVFAIDPGGEAEAIEAFFAQVAEDAPEAVWDPDDDEVPEEGPTIYTSRS